MQVDSHSAADVLGYSKKVTSEEDQKQNLAQDDFIKLMLSQFQNQDPFAENGSGDFLAQMAQFSTVEGIGDMQKSLESMVSGMKSSRVLEASSLVGKGALVASDTVDYQGDDINGSIELPMHSDTMKITITGASGATIDTITMNNVGPGLVDFSWGGTNSEGGEIPRGNYDISATFFNGEGHEVAATFIRGGISSVSLDSGASNPLLEVQGVGFIPLDSVREISATN
ncbi:MAG: hypothetical protein HRU20_06760 [Pseudomonadales bacterium]|nr:hypothetical protein [Pseudomonadales bacterium]